MILTINLCGILSCVLLSIYPVFSNMIATEKPLSLTVLEGGTAIFHCHVSQQIRESYDIAWYSESRNVFLSRNAILRSPDADIRHRYSISRLLNHRFDLKIENVKTSDAGTFSCMFAYQDTPLQKAYYNNVGQSAELVVWAAPTVSSPECLLNTLSNEDVEFVCVSEGGNPRPSLELYVNGNRLQTKTEVNGHSLYLRVTLTEAYRGVEFQCRLESKALQSPKTCSLSPLPPVVRITPKQGTVMENEEIKFNCSSHGLENPTYEWMATPTLILMQRFSSDSEMETLTIREAKVADNGSTIICIATGANGDKVASEEAVLMVEERIGARGTQTTHLMTSIGNNATGLQLPLEPRARHSVIDFFHNNVLILAVCVAGIFIVLLSVVAVVIVFKRKRKSYNVNVNIFDEDLGDKIYEKFDRRDVITTNPVSETERTEEETKQDSCSLVSPAASPTRSPPRSPKQYPKFASNNSLNLCLEQPNGSNGQQPIPHYAKPNKGKASTLKHPPPAYATPIKRDFHLSLEDVTDKSSLKNASNDSQLNQRNAENHYAEPTISPTKNNLKENKYEEILPTLVVDPRKLNVEGLKYADLEMNQNCSSEIKSDLSLRTQYAVLAKPNDATDDN